MNRTETIQIMAVLRGAYPGFYRDISKREAEDTVNLWQSMFANDNATVVSYAVKAFIEADTKGFPPAIGQVKEKMRLLTGKEKMGEGKAWAMVAKAIRNGIYGYQEEFDALPPIIQQVIGAPEQLKDWAQADSDTVHSVIASNFQRAFRARLLKQKEMDALPLDVKKALGIPAGAEDPVQRVQCCIEDGHKASDADMDKYLNW